MPGTLFVVATPIGNLEDITLRALRVLREAAVIAAEDTRHTAGLLAHYAIGTPRVSLHEHNEQDRAPELVSRLVAGEDVALVSDAGMPLVSDPGMILVRAAATAGVRVEVLPGPSAVMTALVASGLPGNAFSFVGFPPSRAAERRDWLARLAAEPRTIVLFEAPHRVVDTLTDALGVLGDRDVAVARELTKMHEEVIRGRLSDALARLGSPRGEYTVVIAPAPEDAPAAVFSDEDAWREFCRLTDEARRSRRDAVATLARRYGRSTRDVYAAIERGKASVR